MQLLRFFLFRKRLTKIVKSVIIYKIKRESVENLNMPSETKAGKAIGIFLWVAIFVMALIIFVFSNMGGAVSTDVSEPFIEKTNGFVTSHIVTDLDERPDIDKYILKEQITVFIRKSAHIFEYFLLGILLYWRFRLYGVDVHRAGLYSLCVSLIFAVADEYHQTFIDGRYGCLEDVLIDSAGIVAGILISAMITVIVLQKKKRKAKKELSAAI